jgi:hypothetical protein
LLEALFCELVLSSGCKSKIFDWVTTKFVHFSFLEASLLKNLFCSPDVVFGGSLSATVACISSRNRLSPRYILYSNNTDDTRVQNKENVGQQQKHAQKKRNEDNGESTKR